MTFFFLCSLSFGAGDGGEGLLSFFNGFDISVTMNVAGRSLPVSDTIILSLIALSISACSVTVLVVVTSFDDLVVINVLALITLTGLS
jgi:hypothetical protein